jgi:hypothetical protein
VLSNGRMALPLHCGQAGTPLSCAPIDNVTATALLQFSQSYSYTGITGLFCQRGGTLQERALLPQGAGNTPSCRRRWPVSQ